MVINYLVGGCFFVTPVSFLSMVPEAVIGALTGGYGFLTVIR